MGLADNSALSIIRVLTSAAKATTVENAQWWGEVIGVIRITVTAKELIFV
jgi:hypothetical protein